MAAAKYLLSAPQEDMDRWKRAAEEAGMSFAAWLRFAAEQLAAPQTIVLELGELDARAHAQSSYPYGAGIKRSYRPDPK